MFRTLNCAGLIFNNYRPLMRSPNIVWLNSTFCRRIVYRAAILEELDKPLLITNINNKNITDAGMVRVKVEYCSLNLTDVLRMSDPNSQNLLPQIPGCEFSGHILEVGNYTTKNFKPGDKCVALLDYDHQIGGGLSEESIVSESDCFHIDSVSTKIAAQVLKGHGSALYAFDKCDLDENDIVIVISGAGGNGLAAVQVAKHVYKAKVYVISETEDASALTRDEGAHKAISIHGGLAKVYKFLESALNGQKAKVIYDAVGKGLMYVAADFVDPVNGHFISVDPQYNSETFSESRPEFKKTKKKSDDSSNDIDDFVAKIQHVNLSDLKIRDKEAFDQTVQDTLSLCEEEIITPYVSKIFKLSEVNEAVEFIKSKQCAGKVLIDLMRSDNEEDKKNDDDDNDKDGKDDTDTSKKPTKDSIKSKDN